MSCWVGAYIEAGAGTSGSSGVPYMPFVFCGPATRAEAEKQAGAKLLAGPFATSQEAQNWATAYERNPNTLHAGSGLSPSTGTVKGDTPPAPVSGLAAIGDFFSRLTEANTWIRLAKIVVGGALLLIGLSHMTGADNAVANAGRRVPLPI